MSLCRTYRNILTVLCFAEVTFQLQMMYGVQSPGDVGLEFPVVWVEDIPYVADDLFGGIVLGSKGLVVRDAEEISS